MALLDDLGEERRLWKERIEDQRGGRDGDEDGE